MDKIKYEILEDGTVTIDTDQISGPNHLSADELLRQLSDLLGGGVEVRHKKSSLHQHSHSHDHDHHHH